jgi:hypothetical protein
MVSSVTHVTQAQPAARAQSTTKRSPESKPKPVEHTQDSVHLSSTAQAAKHEAAEPPAQAAKEAGTSDPQAHRLQARQAAVAKAYGAR